MFTHQVSSTAHQLLHCNYSRLEGMSCWGLVLGCLFVCLQAQCRAAGEGGMLCWQLESRAPAEPGQGLLWSPVSMRPALGFAVSQGRKVPGGKGHLFRRAGMELNHQILKCCDCSNRKPTAGMGSEEAPGTRGTMDQFQLQLCSKPECAWAEQGQASPLTPSQLLNPKSSDESALHPCLHSALI